MSYDERARESHQKIKERSSRFEFAKAYIDEKRSDGILGKAEISRDDIVLLDTISAKIESECTKLSHDIEFANPRSSVWKRSKESVEKRIDYLLKVVKDTCSRREGLSDLYKAVFYQKLPPQRPELTLSIVVPQTDPTALDSLKIGVKEALAECSLPATSMSQVDFAQVHDAALFLMCKRAISLIELLFEKADSKKDSREFIVRKAMLLQECLRASRKDVTDKTKLVNLASSIVSDMTSLEETEVRKVSKSIFQENLQKQEKILKEVGFSISGTQALQPRDLNSFLLRETEAEETWRWGASEQELAAWEEQKGSNRERPWSVAQGQGYKIKTVNFTYEFLKNRLPAVTGVPILFMSPPRSDQQSTSTYPEEGGFSVVHRIKLPQEFKVSDAASSAWAFLEVCPVKDVAVKYIKAYKSGSPSEDERRTCIRLARETRIWSKMRHVNIVPLMGFWDKFAPTSKCLSFVSPWMDQGTLLEYMEEDQNIDELQRFKFLVDIASALSYMHNQPSPITHGDLRANNVLLKNNTAYLCDFGISNILDQSRGLTTGQHGNVRWQAAEQLIVDPETGVLLKANIRTDMYSFGSVFLEVMTGAQPWSAYSLNQQKQLEEYRRKNPDVTEKRPPEIRNDDYWTLMMRCWRKEPTLRPTANMVLFSMTMFVKEIQKSKRP